MALNDSGLLVRYYVDEAASGSGPTPTQLLDSSGNAYHLDITYDSTKWTWAEDGSGNRYLSSSTPEGVHRAVHAIDNTSDLIRDNMVGKKTATLEFVVEVGDVTSNISRIGLLINGRAGEYPALGLGCSAATGWRIYWNENQSNAHTLSFGGRKVFHVVFDTNLSSNREKVYVNGSLLWNDDLGISQNSTLAINSDNDLIACNRASGVTYARQFTGGFYYAALYTEAFTAQRCSDHYDVLTLDDDTPTASGPVIRRTTVKLGAGL